MKTLLNTTSELGPLFQSPSEIEIQKCPQHFLSSPEFILSSPSTPDFIKDILLRTPWKNDRKNKLVQIRVASLSSGQSMLGKFWHLDTEFPSDLNSRYIGQDWNDMRVHLLSFGPAPTEFIKTPFELTLPKDIKEMNYEKMSVLIGDKEPFQTFTLEPGQQISYTSFDAHRSTKAKEPGWRILVSCAECDGVEPLNRTIGRSFVEN